MTSLAMQSGTRTRGNEVLSLDSFIAEMRVHGATATVVVGPRTQGAHDDAWEADVRTFQRSHDIESSVADSQTAVSPLMTVLAARNNPAVQFAANQEVLVNSWFVTEFKRAYQALRIPDKRPWPEFASSLRTGIGFVPADFSAIGVVCGVDVVALDGCDLIIASLLRDKPFDTRVVDARSTLVVPLGSVCRDAIEAVAHSGHSDKTRRLRATASALAMTNEKCSSRILASKVAARTAALNAFKGGCEGHATSMDDFMSSCFE